MGFLSPRLSAGLTVNENHNYQSIITSQDLEIQTTQSFIHWPRNCIGRATLVGGASQITQRSLCKKLWCKCNLRQSNFGLRLVLAVPQTAVQPHITNSLS